MADMVLNEMELTNGSGVTAGSALGASEAGTAAATTTAIVAATAAARGGSARLVVGSGTSATVTRAAMNGGIRHTAAVAAAGPAAAFTVSIAAAAAAAAAAAVRAAAAATATAVSNSTASAAAPGAGATVVAQTAGKMIAPVLIAALATALAAAQATGTPVTATAHDAAAADLKLKAVSPDWRIPPPHFVGEIRAGGHVRFGHEGADPQQTSATFEMTSRKDRRERTVINQPGARAGEVQNIVRWRQAARIDRRNSWMRGVGQNMMQMWMFLNSFAVWCNL